MGTTCRWIYFGENSDFPHGIGIKVWRDGRIEEGYWMAEKLNGRGRRIYSDGSYYIGEFKKGNKFGLGTDYRDGNKFTKNWSNLLDPGEIIYKNGEKYKGQWNDNFEKHGEGTLYSADGQVISSGNWEWDKYVDNLT